MDLFSRAVGSVLHGDPPAAQRLSELCGLLGEDEDEQRAIGFVVAAIEVLLAVHADGWEVGRLDHDWRDRNVNNTDPTDVFDRQPAVCRRNRDRSIAGQTEAIDRTFGWEHWPAALVSRLRQAHADAVGGRGVKIADALTARCTRHGSRWRVELGARTAHLDQCVGLLHLAVLTANPGVEIPAIDLVTGPHRLDEAAGRGGMSAQPLLDRAARQQYGQRLLQLREEIDDLQARGDHEGANRATAERDWVLSELTAGTGLLGRARTFADDGERARIAVGRAIRRALTRIEQADPVIGTHLRTAVHTGMNCWYRPT